MFANIIMAMNIIVAIIILVILTVIYFMLPDQPEHMYNIIQKPILWAYWELKPGHTSRPPYINICFKTFNNASNVFDIHMLNEKTIYNYLPDLRKDINELPIALKTDYIRIALLYKYGGLWLDADTIVMNNLQTIKDKIDSFDFVGFGCTGNICTNGMWKPSNGAMGSRKQSILMGKCLEHLDKKLNEYFSIPKDKRKEFNYFDLGKLIIWDELAKLQNTGYIYYHFPSWADGSRDINGAWIAPDLIFEKNHQLLDSSKVLIVFLANSIYCGSDTKYNWFCSLSEEQILQGKSMISTLFRKALK